MIANCPGCGTHFKHEPPRVPVRARCGRCDASFSLGRLRPYRIVSAAPLTAEQVKRVASRVPIGWDDPVLAATIAENLASTDVHADVSPVPVVVPVGPTEAWGADDDPLPQIPEMTLRGAYDASEQDGGPVASDEPREDEAATTPESRGEAVATFALWTAAGAIAGTGASWTMGGQTITGLAAGAALGTVAGWMWLRWKSPK